MAQAFKRGRIEATTDFDRLAECDAILVCVPTPLGRHREPDLSYVRKTADEIAERLRPGQLVVLESTTYPGTTREELLPRFEARGPRVRHATSSSPSRPSARTPATAASTRRRSPRSSAGSTRPRSTSRSRSTRAAIQTVVPVSSPEVAEAAKILENVFRAVNIALVNEMKVVLDQMGIDVWEVIEAAKTKPFGFMPFYPGPGLGGHCIPIDPFYLTWKAAEHGAWTRFIELAGEINTSMPAYVVERTAHALNGHAKSLKGAKVLVLGLAYKADIDDVRESPSFEIIERLRAAGARGRVLRPLHPGGQGRPRARHRPRVGALHAPTSSRATTCCWCRPRTPTSSTRSSTPARSWWSTRAT